MDQHYRQAMDEAIPMLHGKTPRECAADPTLHQEVVQWLKSIETRSDSVPAVDYDFTWIWSALRLMHYRG